MKKIVTLTGPSCSGKTVLQGNLISRHGFIELMSTTTRSPRIGEVNGMDYDFVGFDDFERLISDSMLVQHIVFGADAEKGIRGDYYGVTKTEAQRKLETGRPIVVIVEPAGIPQFKRYAKEVGADFYSVFINVDLEVAESRMMLRDAGAPTLERRLKGLRTTEMGWKLLDYDLRLEVGYDKDNEVAAEAAIVEFIRLSLPIAA